MKKFTWFNIPKELDKAFEEIENSILEPADTIAVLGTTTNLPAVAGTYADLAAARTSVAAQNAAVEARLDPIEIKLDEVITKLKAAGIIKA
ncbi:MAG TPA: hypothetical protein VLA48_03290 [Nitrososphaeraceae archaeon]|nr:hypothetical protein [Nitrososphaeraceae archaeon]